MEGNNNNTDVGIIVDDNEDNDECSANICQYVNRINDKHKKCTMHKEKMSISSCIGEANDDVDLKRRSWPLDPSAWEMYLRRMLNSNSNVNL